MRKTGVRKCRKCGGEMTVFMNVWLCKKCHNSYQVR